MIGKPNASRLDYFFRFLSGACVRAEAATDLTVLLFDVLNSLLAFEATPFDVFSFLAIFYVLS